MAEYIKPEIQNLEDYLGTRKEFYIPSYQRPYAWGIGNCEQLIEDILNHKENYDIDNDNYFFGAILMSQDPQDIHENTLIDGQQRTTTFILLLKAILIKLNIELQKLNNASGEDGRLIKRLEDYRERIINALYHFQNEDMRDDYIDGIYEINDNNIKYINNSISEKYSKDLITILKFNNLHDISNEITRIKGKHKENKFTNFYKNFKYFSNYIDNMGPTEIRDFALHLLNKTQVIVITSYNTDQAINIFNSLNGTGIPLTPVEVIVSKTMAGAGKNKEEFEKNWGDIVERADSALIDLTTLISHYIFVKLSSLNRAETRNPGIRAFFNQNKHLLLNTKAFTDDINKILDDYLKFTVTSYGQLFTKFNGGFISFVLSFSYYRGYNKMFFDQLLKLAILVDVTEYAYSSSYFKRFLERINLKYSNEKISDIQLIEEFKKHIEDNFNKEEVYKLLVEGGVKNSLLYINEYLFSVEKNKECIFTEKVDIEHIMPKSGKDIKHIMDDANFEDIEDFNEYVEKIGNKILLEANINRKIGNSWFRTKRNYSIKDASGYKDSQYNIALSLVDYESNTWTKEDIDKATEKAATRITKFIFDS
ncbi:DUF262 domain-containing HNH endonuclease family protein [Macrococcus capreoli]